MAGSGNNLMKNVGGLSVVPSGLGAPSQAMPPPMKHPEMSEPQAQALKQSQLAQAQLQAHAKAAHAQFQATIAQSQKQSLMGRGNINVNLGVSSPTLTQTPTPKMAMPTPSFVTPNNAKRSGHKQSSRPAGFSGGAASSPLKTMELAPVARRRKRALPKNQIPEKVAAFLPESAIYTQLLEFEGRVDAALARKKVDIQDSVKNPTRVQKTLRIHVFNTFANQTQTGIHRDNNEPPSWSLKILGRILEKGSGSDSSPVLQKPTSASPKFSSFFKKITIYLDQKLYPDNHVILWESSRSLALNEGFEVKRKGDKEFTAIIRLEMNYTPEKFKLSPPLSELLGLEIETRPRIIAAIWHYVKIKSLQIPNDTSFFTCDPPLRKLFGEEKMKFSMVSQKISQHLSQPQPIHLEHKIRLSGDNPVGNTCYDVLVDIPLSLDKDMSNFLEKLEKHREIDVCDEAICAAIKKIHEHRRRRAFFLGFSQSPGEFINSFVESQSRDLKTAVGEATLNAEKEQRAEFYNQPWVEDAVIRYLNRTAGSSNAPGST